VYANVPYKIASYEDLLKNPKDTITFDHELDIKIRQEREQLGADGALLRDENRFIIKVNFIEKILATSLAKLSNFIPEGGIWMNTQRPEWNDANNALVGNGVSMVTLYYLRRFFNFFEQVLSENTTEEVELSNEVLEFFNRVYEAFDTHQDLLKGTISDTDRKKVLDAVGQAGSDFRNTIYENAFSGRKSTLSMKKFEEFVKLSNDFLEHAIRANKREDNLYHAYNLMTVNNDDSVSISYLYEMLEGQVAALSSGYLSAEEVLKVLDAMKESKLFRHDQYSYLLYPNKELKGFLERNNIPANLVLSSTLLLKLLNDGNTQIVEKDVNDEFHFNGNFKNAEDLAHQLDQLSQEKYGDLLKTDRQKILDIFEEVFNHKAFTGRSGTFYGYEGLGSIYWHMVSKLLLAVQECCTQAVHDGEDAVLIGKLLEHFYEINEGIGVHKPPTLYGAFPTDPYSHTPWGRGAQQPGMTGQVKEDILSRYGELGIYVDHGKLGFYPCLLRKSEFIKEAKDFKYVNLFEERKSISMDKNSLGFTYCQVPIVYHIAEKNALEVHFKDGTVQHFDSLEMDRETSDQIFKRTGKVERITAQVEKSQLK
jgi:hypothetical protein